jgi:salicylate hydroxylase
MSTPPVIIAGGGIGGMAAALACARSNRPVQVFERAPAFEPLGAGVQLGPNVTRILHAWGLREAMRDYACYVPRLQVKRAQDGAVLATLPLGHAFAQRYSAPYVTLHRADLHTLLAQAAREAGVTVRCNRALIKLRDTDDLVHMKCSDGSRHAAAALIGADGLHSTVRAKLLRDGAPRATGHLAFRAMVEQSSLPQALRSEQVTVWLGPQLHVVQYPVCAGQWLNVVAFIHGSADVHDTPSHWDNATTAAQLNTRMAHTASDLQTLLQAMPQWRLWVMYDRTPLPSARAMAHGHIALLGDAAHPMRPYLAQGAGMAIEDAAALGEALSGAAAPMPQLLARYAERRWQRNARVQQRALRNGHIFHATGWMRLGRDTSLRVLGARLLDMPWLYGFDALLRIP